MTTETLDAPREVLEPLPQFSLKQVLAVAIAFAVLGLGIGYLVATRQEEPTAVDLGFTRDMIDHHDQAVRMSERASKHASDREVRELATRMAMYQKVEANEYTMLMRHLGFDA